MQHNKINIAIDGFSSCGKSTLAKQLAESLKYIHIDSGSMYRAVSLYFIQNSIPLEDVEQINKALEEIIISFENIGGQNIVLLNGKAVIEEIRSSAVDQIVSHVASILEVRKKLVYLQNQIAVEKGVVMDGRDIGTVVIPDAEIKIFLTANEDVRTERRLLELKTKGKDVTFEEVKRNLLERDRIDSTREHSPLVKAQDAIVIDNSYLTQEEQLGKVLNIINDIIPNVQ